MQKASKTVLVTGASSGIGYALAHLFFEKGYRLLLFGRNKKALSQLEHELLGALVFTADLATKEGQDLLVEVIAKHTPDIVINNAGLGYYGEGTIEESFEMIEVNCKALVAATFEAIDVCRRAQKEGVICNISSSLSSIPTPYMATYAASKAFVDHFSLAKDEEVACYGIRVLTTCPGPVTSDFRFRASHEKKFERNPSFLQISPERAAELIYEQIKKKKRLKVIDQKTAFFVLCARLLPVRWVVKFMKNELKKLINK